MLLDRLARLLWIVREHSPNPSTQLAAYQTYHNTVRCFVVACGVCFTSAVVLVGLIVTLFVLV